jgi:hypothetical protein
MERRSDKRFAAIDRRFSGVDERFESMEARFDRRFASGDARLESMSEKLDAILGFVKHTDEHTTRILDEHEERLQALERR